MQNMTSGKTALGLDNNIGALICYVGNFICMAGLIYSIIVITQDKTNKLPRFHAFQSVILSVASLIVFVPLGIIMFIVSLVLSAVSTTVSMLVMGVVGLVMCVVGLAMFYFVVMAAINAYKGEIYKIPFVGDYAEKYSNG
jgi:uncharacterized membrane protein